MKIKKRNNKKPLWLCKIKKKLPKHETFAKILCFILAGLMLLGMLTTFLY